jgi:hypothetical protein
MGLAAFGNDSFCEVSRTEIRICKRTGTNWSFSGLQLGSPYSMDVVEWESGVAIVTEAGEIAHVEPGEGSDSTTSTPKPKVSIRRLSSTPFRRVFALLEKGLATLGDDSRLRFWLHANEGFELRADFKVQGPGTTCALALCDGRIAYGDARGVLIAAPDITGVWRQDDLIGFYGRGVTSIAALSENRVAFLRDRTSLVIGTLQDDDLSIEYLGSGMNNVTALAAVDPDTLAVLESDRQIRILSRGSRLGTSWVESSSRTYKDPVTHLAANNGRIVAIVGNEPHLMTCREGQLSDPGKPPEAIPPNISAVAINESGRVALAIDNGILTWNPTEPASAPWHIHGVISDAIVGLSWGSEAELLCVGSLGYAARVNVDSENVNSLVNMETGGGMALGAIAASGMAVRARGTAPILVDSGFQIYGFHGDVKALVVAGSRLLVGADALYVIDLDAIRAGRVINLRRILVREDWVLNTELDFNGSVRSVHLRRTQGEHWNTQTIGGRPVPDDPRLQACIGTVRANSQLGEITETRNYVFNPDRSIFSMDVVD